MNRIMRHYSFAFLLSAFLACHVSLGEPVTDIPDTPAGNRIRESLEVINSGDMARIQEYITSQFTSGFHKMFGKDRLFDVFYGFYEKYQGLEFHKARESSPNKLVGVFRCRSTGSAYLFGLTVLRKPPHKIQGMTLLPLAHPDQPESLVHLAEPEKIKMLDAFLDRLGKDGVFSGAALLAKDGNVLSNKAYGLAWREQGESNRIETRFNLASLNKMFTALAVAQLCEQGKMSYEDPIDTYLGKDWIPAKVARKIQVKHLLSHTSGIGISDKDDNLRYLDVSIRNKFRRIDDYKSLTSKAFLKSKPGKKYAYSNIGMHLLGSIIEKVSGDSFCDYVEKHIFKAAGMHDTGFFELDRLPANTARGYVKELENGDVSWRSNDTQCSWKGTPAGGAYSTVGDLMKFEQALKKHSLVSPETRDTLFTAKTELNAPSYGFGFSVRHLGEQLKVGHTGGYIGINNHFSMYLDNGYTVIILSNIDLISGSVCSDIEFFITSLFFE